MNRLTMLSFCLFFFPSPLRAQGFATPIVDKMGIVFADPKAAAISALSNGSLVFSGGWTSGGGELIDQRSNPWFLQLSHERFPQVIHYCIVRSPDYPLQLNIIKSSVSSVLNLWRDEFFEYFLEEGKFKNNDFVLGREVFYYDASCSGDADKIEVDQLPHRLLFQFGYLSSKQEQGLLKIGKDKASLVGIAVRTGYDAKALQGKGFIYLASGEGKHQVSPESLQHILIHEMGHVYGLKHTGNDNGIMAEDFPHNAMLKKSYWYFSRPGLIVSFNKKFMSLGLTPSARKFFNIHDDRAFDVVYKFTDSKTILLELSFADRDEVDDSIVINLAESKKLGHIELSSATTPVRVVSRIDPIKNDGSLLSFNGPEIVEYAGNGVFVDVDGQRNPVTVRFSPKGMEIGTLIDDVLYFNIFAQ